MYKTTIVFFFLIDLLLFNRRKYYLYIECDWKTEKKQRKKC